MSYNFLNNPLIVHGELKGNTNPIIKDTMQIADNNIISIIAFRFLV